MSSEASKPPTPPAAFRSALLFPEDANLKAYATPDSPSENPLNQARRDSQPPPLALDDAAGEQVDDATAVPPDVDSPHPLLPASAPSPTPGPTSPGTARRESWA